MNKGKQFFIGIDPQPSLLAVHVRDIEDNDILWYQVILKRKDAFKNAEMWELYTAEQCRKTIMDLNSTLSYIEISKKVYLAIEQQRGRVKSIAEACLVTAAMEQEWEIVVPHPMTWKKTVGLKSEAGNKNNKLASTNLHKADLTTYCEKNGQKKLPLRIHDLCDAKCISQHAKNFFYINNSSSKNEKNKNE